MRRMEQITSDAGNPVLGFYRNFTRLAFVTHPIQPEKGEFWICLNSAEGVLGYFKYKAPEGFGSASFTGNCFGYAQLIEVHPAGFLIPDSATVYELFLYPQQGGF